MKKIMHKLFLIVACQLSCLNLLARLPEDNVLRNFAKKANTPLVQYDQESQNLYIFKDSDKIGSDMACFGVVALASFGIAAYSAHCFKNNFDNPNAVYGFRSVQQSEWMMFQFLTTVLSGILGMFSTVATGIDFKEHATADVPFIVMSEEAICIDGNSFKYEEIAKISMENDRHGKSKLSLLDKYNYVLASFENFKFLFLPIEMSDVSTVLNIFVQK